MPATASTSDARSTAPVPAAVTPPTTPDRSAVGRPTRTGEPVPAAPSGRPAPAIPSGRPAPTGHPVPPVPPVRTAERRPVRPARVVVLDPGHNGGNGSHRGIIERQVPDGTGGTKACNTTGTETAAGYPEHAFTFDVAVRARRLLAARGVTVLLTRPDDSGVGPCVDARARFGNAHAAAAVVSVHADGAAATGSGFHVIERAGTIAGSPTARLAQAVRSAFAAGSGLGYADYTGGGDGLDERPDLAGLNLTTRPAVIVECGNMRNAGDAAILSSPTGRQAAAGAVAAGILAFLG